MAETANKIAANGAQTTEIEIVNIEVANDQSIPERTFINK